MAGISYVFTISRVAEMLDEDEEWLDEISIVLDPEDGRLGVLGIGEESITAFTPFGIDNLAELVQIYKTLLWYFRLWRYLQGTCHSEDIVGGAGRAKE